MNIVFVLFDDVTQLDFTGPAQLLSRLPEASVYVAASTLDPINSDSGFGILPNTTFDACPQADLLCIPGGFGTAAAIENNALITFVKQQAIKARYVTSVCTGALILGAAGLLNGKKATTHWAYAHLLAEVGATHVDERVVRDGNIFTGGGVTAGIDFALTLVTEIAGTDYAQALQLGFEYNPAPPYQSGHPSVAPAAVLAASKSLYDGSSAGIKKALDRLKS